MVLKVNLPPAPLRPEKVGGAHGGARSEGHAVELLEAHQRVGLRVELLPHDHLLHHLPQGVRVRVRVRARARARARANPHLAEDVPRVALLGRSREI